MRPRKRKLALARETIRVLPEILPEHRLARVVGGIDSTEKLCVQAETEDPPVPSSLGCVCR
jgi:hypothetical protein